MAELQPSDVPAAAAPPPAAAAASIAPAPPPAESAAAAANSGAAAASLGQGLAPKRQRRPSVRLGEIGESPYDAPPRRGPKTWRFHKDPSLAAKTSKIRPLTNLVNGAVSAGENYDEANAVNEDNNNNNNFAFDLGNRKPKMKPRPTKRARTNWTASSSKFDAVNGGIEGESFFREEKDHADHEEFRDFEPEGSESPLKEQSPVNSMENLGLQYWDRRANRARLSESRDNDNLNNGGIHTEMNSQDRSSGVRDWLIGLGLGRYSPVFEIHEVDDEVLPMLTLEDLKDMGINAVGSRRKMYTAILKLRKGFS
nr:pollen-specific leucine-rich repeat extensin-like protein 1 [Ipomoea batatas]